MGEGIWTVAQAKAAFLVRSLTWPGGMPLPAAWGLLRPVWVYAQAQHGQGMFFGILTTDDIFPQDSGPAKIVFTPRPWASIRRGKRVSSICSTSRFSPPSGRAV